MKKLLVLFIVITSLYLMSCKKESAGSNNSGTKDTINIALTLTDSIVTNPLAPDDEFGDLEITPIMNPTVSGLFANAYIDFDVYDSTAFRYSAHSQQVILGSGGSINYGSQTLGLHYNNGDSIINANGTTKFNIRNLIIDSVHWDQANSPNDYLIFHY